MDPLSGAQVEEDFEDFRKILGSAYANFTPVPPKNALEVEMLLRQFCHERRKGLERDLLIGWMWKTINPIVTYVDCPNNKIPRLELQDY